MCVENEKKRGERNKTFKKNGAKLIQNVYQIFFCLLIRILKSTCIVRRFVCSLPYQQTAQDCDQEIDKSKTAEPKD